MIAKPAGLSFRLPLIGVGDWLKPYEKQAPPLSKNTRHPSKYDTHRLTTPPADAVKNAAAAHQTLVIRSFVRESIALLAQESQG